MSTSASLWDLALSSSPWSVLALAPAGGRCGEEALPLLTLVPAPSGGASCEDEAATSARCRKLTPALDDEDLETVEDARREAEAADETAESSTREGRSRIDGTGLRCSLGG